ncbi:MAG: hypothetical protein KH305_10965, partial [Sutterella wadsworthensis]|nr:hypothetical protein [Sutterella wadsworthensis]
ILNNKYYSYQWNDRLWQHALTSASLDTSRIFATIRMSIFGKCTDLCGNKKIFLVIFQLGRFSHVPLSLLFFERAFYV